MPIYKITRGGVPIGYRYGKHGKLYTFSQYGHKGAYIKAKKQMAAIHMKGG